MGRLGLYEYLAQPVLPLEGAGTRATEQDTETYDDDPGLGLSGAPSSETTIVCLPRSIFAVSVGSGGGAGFAATSDFSGAAESGALACASGLAGAVAEDHEAAGATTVAGSALAATWAEKDDITARHANARKRERNIRNSKTRYEKAVAQYYRER